MATGGELVVRVRLDPAELFQAVDELPDEVLDRLAVKVLQQMKRRERRQGRG